MKKLLAIILALTMIAGGGIPLAVSAALISGTTEVEAVAQGPNRGDWTVDGNKYTATNLPGTPNFGLYILGNSTKEVTLSATLAAGNEYGFMFAIQDANRENRDQDVQIYQSGDQYYLVEHHIENGVNKIGIERNEGDWSGWAKDYDLKDTDIADGKITLKATYLNGTIKVYLGTSDKPILEYTDDKPLTGIGYGLASKAKGIAFENVSFTDSQTGGYIMASGDKDVVMPNMDGKEIVKVDTSTVAVQNFSKTYGNITVDKLFDESHLSLSEADKNNNSRFAADFSDNTRGGGSISWKVADSKGAIVNYLVINAGRNAGQDGTFKRIADGVMISGSCDGKNWDVLSFTNRTITISKADQFYCIDLDNDTAYSYYKIEFRRIKSDPGAIELYGLFLYADPDLNHETLVHESPDQQVRNYYQDGKADGDTRDVRILSLAKEGYLTGKETVTIVFTNDTGDTRTIVLGENDTVTAYASIDGTLDGKTSTYFAVDGSVIMGWIVKDVPIGYNPTSVTINE